VLISFFGGLGLGQVAPRDQVHGMTLFIASVLDIAGTKMAVFQKRAEMKDYLDIDALLRNGVDSPTALAAGCVVYGRSFNPLITLKALSFFTLCRSCPVKLRHASAPPCKALMPRSCPF